MPNTLHSHLTPLSGTFDRQTRATQVGEETQDSKQVFVTPKPVSALDSGSYPSFSKKGRKRTYETAQQLEMLADKPEDTSRTPGTHLVEGDN